MKSKQKQMKQEGGITLIALIITIIVLVILAAVTLNSLFGNNIIGIAVNGAINYAEEQQKELGMLNEVSDMLGDITGDTDRPMMPSITLNGTKGNNDIYTSNVTVTISINKGLEQTGTIKLHYKINDGEEQISEEDVSFEVSEEGTTTIIAWTENEKGNLSDNYETSFTINKTAPSMPTISLNGTEGENEYYITDVGVTINAGDTTDVASIKYKVEGANTIEETEATGTTANFDITEDGTSTITAYIINTAGLTSEEITQVVNKDATVPSTASIALSGEAGETSISVTANGEDATSGVASYAFQYSTTNEESGFTTALEVQNTANSCTFEYQDLASDTTYYLRVIVKDKAGNTTPSIAVPATTKKAGLSDTELASNVGKYVDYTPASGTFTSEGQYNGGGDQNFSTITSLKWRILKASDNTLTLISDTTANTGFYLSGANGYNNGVLLLNNACKEMYSNSNLGATGRSLNIDDIEEVSSYNGTEYSDRYGTQGTASNTSYPRIFEYEITGAPRGVYGTKYNLSEQDSYVTGIGSGYPLIGIFTYYNYKMTSEYVSPTYLELFVYNPGTTAYLDQDYWIASRCAQYFYGTSSFHFGMFYIGESMGNGGFLRGSRLYESDSTAGAVSFSYAIRPCVNIDLSKVNVGLTGDGSSGSPYSITAK